MEEIKAPELATFEAYAAKKEKVWIYFKQGKKKGKWFQIVEVKERPCSWNPHRNEPVWTYFDPEIGSNGRKIHMTSQWAGEWYVGELDDNEKEPYDFLGSKLEIGKPVFGCFQSKAFVGTIRSISQRNVTVEIIKHHPEMSLYKQNANGKYEVNIKSEDILMLLSKENLNEVLMLKLSN